MIVVDANIWIDHFRIADLRLARLASRRLAFIHPFTIAEVMLGSFGNRQLVFEELSAFPTVPVAEHHEVLHLIEQREVFGTGIGYVDSHLLASVLVSVEGKLWTRDKRLLKQAERLEVAYQP